jgi:hypothetical protein
VFCRDGRRHSFVIVAHPAKRLTETTGPQNCFASPSRHADQTAS